MKRIIYILLIVAMVTAAIGGITAFADYTADNLTRGMAYADGGEVNTTSLLVDAENMESAAGADTDFDTEAESAESDAGASINPTVGTGTESDAGADTDFDTEAESAESDAGTNSNPTVGAGTESDTDTEKSANPFEVVFSAVRGCAAEILCALSFVGSLILAYAYKKGLLPIIKRGIGAISATVSSIRETAERGESKTDELTRALCERLTSTQISLDGIENAVDTLGKRLDSLESDSDEKKKMRVILSAQIDMLYSIFMTSSLPQYQKDEVGAKIAEMREALLEYEGE